VPQALKAVHRSALALHTEVLSSFVLPRAARERLPSHASSLLPKSVLAELEGIAAAEPGRVDAAAAAAAARVVGQLQLAECDPKTAFLLLERVQRAAEVWSCKAQTAGADPKDIHRFGTGVSLRPLAVGSTLDDSSTECPRGSGSRFSFPLGLGRASKAKLARQVALARGARRLAFEIRRAQPTLGLTSYDAAKVGANCQVQMAMLEAYARVLASSTAPAIAMYTRIAASAIPPALYASRRGSSLLSLVQPLVDEERARLARKSAGSFSAPLDIPAPLVETSESAEPSLSLAQAAEASHASHRSRRAPPPPPPGGPPPARLPADRDAPVTLKINLSQAQQLRHSVGPKSNGSERHSRYSRKPSRSGSRPSSIPSVRDSRPASLPASLRDSAPDSPTSPVSSSASHRQSRRHSYSARDSITQSRRTSERASAAFKRRSSAHGNGTHTHGSTTTTGRAPLRRPSPTRRTASKTQWLLRAAAADIEARLSMRPGSSDGDSSEGRAVSPPPPAALLKLKLDMRSIRDSRARVGLTPGEEESGEVSDFLELSNSSRTAGGVAGPGSLLTRDEEKHYAWAVRKGDFAMVSRVGAGAYGEVWAGRWRRNDVAVKLLSRSEDSDSGKQDFLREMQLLSELRHPNIVRFLGACLDRQNMCILFEICERSLFDLLYKSTEPIDSHYLLTVVREVALGIYYLHHCEPPVLHLDLKSANVLLDEVGTAKVCDFGLSHVKEDAASIQEGERSGVGSPQWTAPEILRGGLYDEKADSYSFGVLLYEVLARQLPYQNEESHMIIVGVITKMLERPGLRPDQAAKWPAQLPKLMTECMSEDPNGRPDMESLLDVLEDVAPKDARNTRMGTPPGRASPTTYSPRYSPESTPRPGPDGLFHHRTWDDSDGGASSSAGYAPFGSPLGRHAGGFGSGRLASFWEFSSGRLGSFSEPGRRRLPPESPMRWRTPHDGVGGQHLATADEESASANGKVGAAALAAALAVATAASRAPAVAEEATAEDLEDAALDRAYSLTQRNQTFAQLQKSGLLAGAGSGRLTLGVSSAVTASPAPTRVWRLEDEDGDGMRYSAEEPEGSSSRGASMLSSGDGDEMSGLPRVSRDAVGFCASPGDSLSSSARASMYIAMPSALRVHVPEVERTKEGKLVFVVEAQLDGVRWTVLRKERDVHELHRELKETLRFMPPAPLAKSRWPLTRTTSPDAAHALGQKLQAYLRLLASNGQWLTPEAATLRQFLQVPITQEQLRAKAFVLEMASSMKLVAPAGAWGTHHAHTSREGASSVARYSLQTGSDSQSGTPNETLDGTVLTGVITDRRAQSFQVGRGAKQNAARRAV